MNDYSLFVIIHTSNKSYLTFTVLGEAGKSTSDDFLKTESGYPKCKSVKVNPQLLFFFIRKCRNTTCVELASSSFRFLKTASWHKSRGNCVSKLGKENYFGCFLLTERGYRNCRSVSATVPLFHQAVREYEMCRHRILFCFLFEDSLVTQFP